MTKIEALQKTIYNLENCVYHYSWSTVNSCNCGVLARTILDGAYPKDCGYMDSKTRKGELTEFAAQAYCMTTNLPLPVVFKALADTGFTHQDILELENLGNDEVLQKMGFASRIDVTGNYKMIDRYNGVDNLRSDKPTVIQYLKAWVEILQEQQQPQYPDITQSLAVLPIEETSDVVKVKEVVK